MKKKIIAIAMTAMMCASTFCMPLSAYARYYGDVDNNGTVDINDQTLVKNHYIGSGEPLDTAEKMRAADVTKDGQVTVADYTIIKKTTQGTMSLETMPDSSNNATSFVNANMAKEAKACADYLWDSTETEYGVNGDWTGLTLDYAVANNPNSDIYITSPQNKKAGIASTGFALSALVLDVKYGWRTKAEAEAKAIDTLTTLLKIQSLQSSSTDYGKFGFFYRFIDDQTGKRYESYEVSSIDTSILVCGALTAGEYFGNQVKTMANQLYSNINWKAFVKTSNNQFYMGWKDGDFETQPWNYYAEQLILYVLGAGAPNASYRTNIDQYNSFERSTVQYASQSFITSWFSAGFTYQFSHAWIDLKGKKDNNGTGIDWFQNSVKAMTAQYQATQDLKLQSPTLYQTYGTGAWGQSATINKTGQYKDHLGLPKYSNSRNEQIDYIAPYTALGSIPFTPTQSKNALNNYLSITQLNHQKYGLYECYSLNGTPWYSDRFYGLNKGITLLMLANYNDFDVWNAFMKNTYVQNGLNLIGIR